MNTLLSFGSLRSLFLTCKLVIADLKGVHMCKCEDAATHTFRYVSSCVNGCDGARAQCESVWCCRWVLRLSVLSAHIPARLGAVIAV